MEIKVLGVGNFFTAKYNHTSFLIDRKYWIECPKNIFQIAKKMGISNNDIENVIITHPHPDHSFGLYFILTWKKYVQKTKLNLFMSKPGLERVKNILKDSMDIDIRDVVNFKELPYKDNDIEIQSRVNIHYDNFPTTALKITRNGKTMGYSGDTAFDPDLIDWLSASDIIIHETSPKGDKAGHTGEDELITLGKAIRDKLWVVHYPDTYSTRKFRMLKEGQTINL